MDPESIELARKQADANLNRTVDALGFQLIDPAVTPEMRSFALKRLEGVIPYIRKLYPEES